MNGPIDKAEKAIADALATAQADINGGTKARAVSKPNGGHLATVGEENAKRLRDAAGKVAAAVEDQAAERLAVAESTVEEAKALQAKAKEIADGIRAAAEVEARNSIEITSKLDDTTMMMEQFWQKFDPGAGQ
ncbi:MAG TPA: hypothetical protein VN903_11355 [Polyangia bacterium]|nr:hypothetical protein [Polyangia bacterium]